MSDISGMLNVNWYKKPLLLLLNAQAVLDVVFFLLTLLASAHFAFVACWGTVSPSNGVLGALITEEAKRCDASCLFFLSFPSGFWAGFEHLLISFELNPQGLCELAVSKTNSTLLGCVLCEIACIGFLLSSSNKWGSQLGSSWWDHFCSFLFHMHIARVFGISPSHFHSWWFFCFLCNLYANKT